MFKTYPYFFLFVVFTPITLAADLRDPTLPGNLPSAKVNTASSSVLALNLSAIWVSRLSKRAIINGASVTVGQKLPDGSLVVKIQPRYVLISQQGVYKKLYLIPSVLNPVK